MLNLVVFHLNIGISTGISWLVLFLVAFPLTAGAAYMLYSYINGGFGRYGRISLSVDDGVPIGQNQSTSRKIIAGLTEVAESVLHVSRSAYDWIRTRFRRHTGYAPVQNYYDHDLPTNDPTSVELDWDDEED